MNKLENGTQTFYSGPKNSSYIIPGVYDLSVEDTNWVLTSSFIIFTMVYFFFRIFVKFKRQIINTNIIQMRKKNYFITIANRLWYVGIWMRFSEKWSEYHDEKHSWYRSWWIYLLALWLWHVIWTRSFYESVYRNRRLFTRLNIFWTLFPTLFSHTFPRIFTFSKYLNDKILRFHF